MDKKFWLDIRENKFILPAGYSAGSLTEELFSYLNSPDPELRDLIAYETFANWLEQGLYSQDELRGYILRLIANLQYGLGDRDTDSVFMRTFSVLFLAEIVYNDNARPFLDRDEIANILSKGLFYLEEEKDPRGYIPESGWAHALAHTADLLFVLARAKQTGREQLEQILEGIAKKLITPTDWVYVHGEDDRLTRAVIAVFQRNLASQDWLSLFTPAENIWIDSYKDLPTQNAFFNSKNFLRTLLYRIPEFNDLHEKDSIMASIRGTLTNMKQF